MYGWVGAWNGSVDVCVGVCTVHAGLRVFACVRVYNNIASDYQTRCV